MKRSLLALALWTATTSALAQGGPFDDTLVQSPSLAKPARGSLAGPLASLQLGPADLGRGGLSLASPMGAPDDRGALGAQVFPTWSPDGGQSEWGMGFQVDLRITRFRELGELDYATDSFASPWGQLALAQDGAYYPRGLGQVVRLTFDPRAAGSWQALTPDGTVTTFRAADAVTTPRGTYAWLMSEVVSIEGDRTELTWTRNESGRPFLSQVRWGGRGAQRQYQLAFVYEETPTPFEDYRAGTAHVLDRRVIRVDVSAFRAGGWAPRYSWLVHHADSLTGPAFYMDRVQRVFASGEAEPPVRYDYDLQTLLGEGTLETLPELEPYLEAWGNNALDSAHATFFDLDEDGVTEFEHAATLTTWRREGTGLVGDSLPTPTGAEDPRCRPGQSPFNVPRQLLRLAPAGAPVRVVSGRQASGQTYFATCDTDGMLLSESQLEGAWAPGPFTRLADVNRDQRPDLVRVGLGSVEVALNEGDADGFAFAAPVGQALSPRFRPEAVWVEDLNGDGVADLVGRARNGFAAWLGTGGGAFDSVARSMSVVNLEGRRIIDLTPLDITWIDANRDGLLDLLTTRGRYVRLYTNDGYSFVERDLPALRNLAQESALPLAIDLSGSGESEIVIVRDSQAHALHFTTPSNGLLVRAEDGRGNEVLLEWTRQAPAPGLSQRSAVLSALIQHTTGQPEQRWDYVLEEPRVHSQSGHLLGFGQVTRASALVAETIRLHHDDDLSGVLLSESFVDTRTPDAFRITRRSFEERSFHGLRYYRLSAEESGFRAFDGSRELVTRTEYTRYERDLCPVEVRTRSRHGLFTRSTTLAQTSSRLPAELTCLPRSIVLEGRHEDPSLDFHHEAQVAYDDLGAVTEVRSIAPEGALVLQSVTYDAEHRVASVARAGQTPASFTWEAGTGRLLRTNAPDGVGQAVRYDPVTDSMLAFDLERGGAPWQSQFAYDGRERLISSWESSAGTSATAPLETVQYREAHDDLPALVRVQTRLSAASHREVMTLSSAADQALTEAVRVPGGFRLGVVTRSDPGQKRAETFRRDQLVADPTTLTVAALFAELRPLGVVELSSFDDPVRDERTVQSGVSQTIVGQRRLTDGALVQTTVENGHITRRAAVDEARRLLWRDDPTGARTSLRYDALGRLAQVTLPGDQNQRVRYDAHGRPAEVVRSGLGRVSYHYDALTGRAQEKRFYGRDGALERSVATRYDAAGRPVVELHRKASTAATRQFQFEYDGQGASGQRGLLTRILSEGFEKRLVYRADGLLLRTELIFPGFRSLIEEREYLDDGTLSRHVRRVVDGAGVTLQTIDERHEFDAYGRLSAVLIDGQPIGRFAYDARGELAGLDLTGGGRIDWRRDTATGEVRGFSHTAPGAFAAAVDWQLGPEARLREETTSLRGQSLTRRYTHDSRGFLTGVDDGVQSAEYAYDVTGLPTLMSDHEGDRTIRREASRWTVGNVDYALDAMGRVVRRGTLEVSYGPSGHIETARDGARTWSYLTDETGQRLARLEQGVVKAVWTAGGLLDGSGFILPLMADGRPIGVVSKSGFTPLLSDARGTLLADASESVGPEDAPTAYGVRSVHPRLAQLLDYVGKSWDPDLRVVRTGVRDYDPLLGTFWQPDPLYLEALDRVARSPVDGNLYSYGRNDPLRFADPSGEDSIGHHYVPEAVTRALQAAGKLSQAAAEEFMTNTTGWPDDVLPHQWSKAHKVYNEAVLAEIEVWGKEQGITDLSKMSKAEAKAFVQHLRGGSNNTFIRGFIRFHEAVTEAAKKYNMSAKQINEVWGPMRKWLTGNGGFSKFLKSGSGLLSKGGKLLGSVGGFLGSAEADFALSFYNDIIKAEEMMKTHYRSPVPGGESMPTKYQWVPRDQPPPSGIDWGKVVAPEARFPEAYARDGA